ncbi:hypothetical protein [Frankia sp. Cas4]|uniref:hypothetical protein n=1 Tax=Frankia sp. Cas4 TaxID=3073927 RepID=UPI002AD42D88|nr:hypothetical protein [Frankia sp. Cas4]
MADLADIGGGAAPAGVFARRRRGYPAPRLLGYPVERYAIMILFVRSEADDPGVDERSSDR